MSLFDYNIFVGTDNGLLKGKSINKTYFDKLISFKMKGINSKAKTFNNLNSMENLTKDKEIVQMDWFDHNSQLEVFFSIYD